MAEDRSGGDPAVRVLLVEDDDTIRSGVAMVLGSEGFVVSAHADGMEALKAARSMTIDLALIDVGLTREPDGFAVARALRALSDTSVIFTTAHGALEDKLEGFASGADDYLVKPYDMAELLARSRAVLARTGRGPTSALTVAGLRIDPSSRRVVGETEINLTQKEFDLLLMLARHRNQVLSKVQLYEQVWGQQDPSGSAANVIEVHMSGLRKKLHPHAGEVIRTFRGVGYSLRA